MVVCILTPKRQIGSEKIQKEVSLYFFFRIAMSVTLIINILPYFSLVGILLLFFSFLNTTITCINTQLLIILFHTKFIFCWLLLVQEFSSELSSPNSSVRHTNQLSTHTSHSPTHLSHLLLLLLLMNPFTIDLFPSHGHTPANTHAHARTNDTNNTDNADYTDNDLEEFAEMEKEEGLYRHNFCNYSPPLNALKV